MRKAFYFSIFLLFPCIVAAQKWQELNKQGKKLYEQGKYKESSESYEKALIQAEKELGINNEDYAIICSNLGDLYRIQERYEKAESLLVKALNIQAKVSGEETVDYAQTCSGLGILYESLGRYNEAKDFYIQAKTIREKTAGKNSLSYAHSCNNLGGLYYNQGLYGKAEPLYIEAKEIKSRILKKDDPSYALSCNNLAALYKAEGLYSKAEPLYLEAKEIRSKMKDRSFYATSCNNLAVLYEKQGLYSKAETLYLEAKEIWEKSLGKTHKNYASACNNLGFLYLKQGLYDKAELLYLEAKDIISSSYGTEHPIYAVICNNLAILYKSKGLYDKAEPLYAEAKQIREKVFGKTHLLYATSCGNLAKLYWNTGNYSQANLFFQESSQILIKQTQTSFSHLSEKEKEQFFNTFKNSFEIYYSYTIESKQTKELAGWLYNNLLVTKGLLFNTTKAIQKTILNSKDNELIKLYNHFIALRRDMAKYNQLSIDQLKKKNINLDSMENVANSMEKQLSQKAYSLGIELSEKTYSWQDIKTKLNKGEALVEIVRIRQAIAKKSEFTDSVQYGVFVITSKTDNPLFFLLPKGNMLEKEYSTNYHRSVVVSKIIDEYSYDAYWKPIKARLKGIKKVYFAPDGIYHKINLNTLYNPENKKYLNQETEIEYITNGKDIIKIKNNTTTKPYQEYKIALFGYPDFKGQNEDKSEYVIPLPGTKAEIEVLSNLVNKKGIQNQKYLYNQANEKTVKNLVSPNILHIATHGFFKKNVEKQENEQYNFFADNPLNRSGLLLANCEQYLQGKSLTSYDAEDGILTANECLNLDLHNTQLVILSACETGLGEVKNGEGVYGLQRALREAGAKCLVMSLWKVNDNATQEFMRLFYENMLVKNYSKKEAFKHAQNTLRKKYPEPYYWGAFVMIGE